MSIRNLEKQGREYRTSQTMGALVEQHRQMLQYVKALPPAERAVIADKLGALTRDDWSDVKNEAVHRLEYDHTYDEIGALVGHRRNVVQRGVVAWRERNSIPDHPLMGKAQRVRGRAAKALSTGT